MLNKDIARHNDNRILHLANYIESNGTTRRVQSPASILYRFAELKRLVKTGEFKTITCLEEDVYKKFGIIEKVDLRDIEEAGKDMERYEKRKNHECR